MNWLFGLSGEGMLPRNTQQLSLRLHSHFSVEACKLLEKHLLKLVFHVKLQVTNNFL